MAYEYRKTYRIFEISTDGLLKPPKRSEGYGEYSYDIWDYDTEQAAFDRIVERGLSDCIIVSMVAQHYVKDPS